MREQTLLGAPPLRGPLGEGLPRAARELARMQEAAEVPDLFAGLALAVRVAVEADACLVSLVDRERDVLRDMAASVAPPARLHSVAEEYELADFPATRQVLDTGVPCEIVVDDPDGDPAERRFLAEIGFARVLMTRFRFDLATVGTIETYRLLDRPFGDASAHQIEVLTTFAHNAHSRIQLAAKLECHYTETIEALVSALEARDPHTEAHAGRIRDMATALAVALQVDFEERRAVKLGAILHDVGKIGISDSILMKPGPLTEEEWAIMRSHPEIGERMLAGIDFLSSALPVIRHHHERWGGGGYPDGLAGERIPLGARIVAVCDSFDAMTSDRPYRRAMTVPEACAELARCSGAQFDPRCVAMLTQIVRHMGDEDLEAKFVRYAL
jgi:hypothetical protein